MTLAAATFQILRTARQHQLRGLLSTAEAGFVRFIYGVPFAAAASILLFAVLDREVPETSGRFWAIVTGAGIAQISGTIALLRAFKLRDFAVGTVYSKTEVLIVAGLGLVGIGTGLTAIGWIGAVLVTLGVIALASKGSIRAVLEQAADPAAAMGLLAALGFGLAAIGIGAAADDLGDLPSFDRAVFTLTAMLVIQTAANGAWFLVSDTYSIAPTVRAWRPAIWVGALSAAGSLAWAWAFTLESAAKVRTLGQVELLIAFGVAYFTLGERHSRSDYIASAAVLAGVVVVAVFG